MRSSSKMMETMIDNASSKPSGSQPISPVCRILILLPKFVRARYGHRSDRIKEASNPGPESGDLQLGSQVAEVVNALEFDLTQRDWRQKVVWLSCIGQPFTWIVVASAGPVGRSCKQVPDLQCLTVRNRVIGSTVGNIMRRLLPTITGRPWCCPNRRMPIRPISGPTQAQGRVPCSTDPPLRWSTQCNPCCSALFRCNCRLRAMNVAVQNTDQRAIEVVASGLPLHHGAQLAVDITLRSALSAAGLPSGNAAHVDGAVLVRARRDKERKYAELLEGDRCHLVIVGVETGGRWSEEAFKFVNALAAAKALETPAILRRSTHLSWQRRWMRMLAISCGKAFASSLVSSREDAWAGTEGATPDLVELLAET